MIKKIMRIRCFAVQMYYKIVKNVKVMGHVWEDVEGSTICKYCGTKWEGR